MTNRSASTTTPPPGQGAGESNSLVAAAKRLTVAPSVRKSRKSAPGWTARAWDYYDLVGEFRYAADWIGSMLSKAELYVADADGEKVDTGVPADLMEALYGGPQGQSEMLKAYGVHLTVAGECYLVGIESSDGTDEWMVVAGTELSARGGKYYIGRDEIKSKGKPFVMKLWRPHPRKHSEPNAPSRAVLGILAEILGLTKHVASQIDSRLAGAGVLLFPSEATFPARPNTDGDSTQTTAGGADEFVKLLAEVMGTAVDDQESAEARVPIAVTMPGEFVDKAKLLQFWTPLDEHAIELRTEAIRRLALGLDMPPEILTGTGDLNHWNAWAVDDAAIKVHAEPLLALISSSLTEGYLRPLLVDTGMDAEEAAGFFVKADTSGIRLRPNRSKEALEIFDRGVLSTDTLLRETGFEPSDQPAPDEQAQWLTRKVAQGSTTPELVAQALRLLGAPFAQVESAPPAQARPTPSLTEHPVQEPPEEPEPGDLAAGTAAGALVVEAVSQAKLDAAAEQMAFRALERAGNRLKTRLNGSRPEGVAASELYLFVPCNTSTVDYLLTDAFSHLDRFCPELGIEPECLTRALDSYCRALLTEQLPHDRELMGKYLTAAKQECGS